MKLLNVRIYMCGQSCWFWSVACKMVTFSVDLLLLCCVSKSWKKGKVAWSVKDSTEAVCWEGGESSCRAKLHSELHQVGVRWWYFLLIHAAIAHSEKLPFFRQQEPLSVPHQASCTTWVWDFSKWNMHSAGQWHRILAGTTALLLLLSSLALTKKVSSNAQLLVNKAVVDSENKQQMLPGLGYFCKICLLHMINCHFFSCLFQF